MNSFGNDPKELNADEKQLYVIKNSGNMSARPDEFKAKAFDKLFGVINFANMSEKDQEIYESEFRWILNRNSEMATALEKGLNQGRVEGRVEGALEKAPDTARKMKAAGIDAATICQCTDLTMEQIGSL